MRLLRHGVTSGRWKLSTTVDAGKRKWNSSPDGMACTSIIRWRIRDVQFPEASFDAIAMIFTHFPEMRNEIFPRWIQWLKPGVC